MARKFKRNIDLPTFVICFLFVWPVFASFYVCDFIFDQISVQYQFLLPISLIFYTVLFFFVGWIFCFKCLDLAERKSQKWLIENKNRMTAVFLGCRFFLHPWKYFKLPSFDSSGILEEYRFCPCCLKFQKEIHDWSYSGECIFDSPIIIWKDVDSEMARPIGAIPDQTIRVENS